MNDREAVKVVIVNGDGQYLAGTATHWEFTGDRSQAAAFDYLEDRVAETIEMIRQAHGQVWVAVKLDPREVYEFCDRCGRRMRALRTYFDGHRFLCGDCHKSVTNSEAGKTGRRKGTIP